MDDPVQSPAGYWHWSHDFNADHLVHITILEYAQVGSRWTCDPAPTDTDEDWLVLIKPIGGDGAVFANGLDLVEKRLVAKGWECNASYEQEKRCEAVFLTARRGELNLIVYNDPVGYGRFLGAASVCKLLNITDKNVRVAAHRAATELEYFQPKDFAF